jgi:alpha-amylase
MRLPLLLLALILPPSLSTPAKASPVARPWTDEIIYFALTDRFLDGDPANNLPPGGDPALFDSARRNINLYHGGDLRGLELALADGYFNDLGITALWITPPVRNAWRSGYDLGGWKTGYHGYWAQDWLDIDPRLASRAALDGGSYPDSPEGRMRHYRDFIRLAHSRGIKVIQDVVLNHAGPVFFYDSNGDGLFQTEHKDEWIQPFKRDGFHASACWADVPAWNLQRPGPAGPRELLGTWIATRGTLARLGSYGRKGFSPDSLGKSDGEEVTCDFFSLRDLWTSPGSAHFDELVDEFVEIHHFYLAILGVDGLRIDTVKHVHHEFWDAFTERLRRRLGPLAAEKFLFGEIYDGNPERLGQYTWRADWPQRTEPCLDAVLDFRFCFDARDYLRRPDGEFGPPHGLERALASRHANDSRGRPLYNPNPGPDGLSARDKIVTFIENHDDINRFRAGPISAARHRLAQALVLLSPGIPCLYYGAEAALHDRQAGPDLAGETGRLTFFHPARPPGRDQVRHSASFREIAALAELRRATPALRRGDFVPLWCDDPANPNDDGLILFARRGPAPHDLAVVAFNASSQARPCPPTVLERACTGTPFQPADLAARVVAGHAPTPENGPNLIPPNSALLYLPPPQPK